MFGIGLPEMIVIFAVALIVVGPDKLPELAKSLAKGIMEMKKTVNQLKDNLAEEDETLNEVQKDLRKTANDLKERMLDTETNTWGPDTQENNTADKDNEIIEIEPENLRPWEVDAQTEPPPSDKEPDEETPKGTENTQPHIETEEQVSDIRK